MSIYHTYHVYGSYIDDHRPHCGLIVGPKGSKTAEGTLYHARNIIREGKVVWVVEIKDLERQPSFKFLVRAVIGEVKNVKRLHKLLSEVPAPKDPERCRHWAEKAYDAVRHDKKTLYNHAGSWKKVYDSAMRYLGTKQVQGRFAAGNDFDRTKPATYDMLAGKERIP